MAESKETFQEKSEQPTSKRKSEARKDGNVAKSMEINSSLILLTGFLMLTIFGGMMFSKIIEADRFIFSQIGQIEITVDVLPAYLAAGFKLMAGVLMPIMLPIVLIGIIANISQFGFLWSFKTLKPKMSNLNPTKGLKKLVSKKSGFELIKNILKVIIVGWIGYQIIAGLTDEMIPLMGQTPWAIYLWICKGTVKIGFYLIFAILILSIFDIMYQRWNHKSEMKMTKQEVKDEAKQSEGDPKVKAKIRQLQLKTVLARMWKDVPKADVVITNPTHIAVALIYDQDNMAAPTVVAKGKRLIAERIKAIALEYDIPIMEEPPLARELFKACEIGEQIPGNLYQTVAEILAYVYRLREENQPIYT